MYVCMSPVASCSSNQAHHDMDKNSLGKKTHQTHEKQVKMGPPQGTTLKYLGKRTDECVCVYVCDVFNICLTCEQLPTSK